jgi:HSP20 family molecular chaperone IbpA
VCENVPPCFPIFSSDDTLDFKNGIGLASKTGYSGPWSLPRQVSTDVDPKTYTYDSAGFSALVDVHQFEPREVSVKTIDHLIVVECKHDSREDGHGYVERRFVRKFSLPNEYDMTTVKSTLTKDGILHLEVPKPKPQGEERHVEITHSEKPSFLMSLLSNRAHSMLRRSHSIPSDNEDE